MPSAAAAIRTQPRPGQCVERVFEAAVAEVQHVVVGQGAHVGPGCDEAGKVGGVHSVMHGLVRRELIASSDARLQVHDADIGCGFGEHVQYVAPRPGVVDGTRNRAVRHLRQRDVVARVVDVSLPQRRIIGMRQDLVPGV